MTTGGRRSQQEEKQSPRDYGSVDLVGSRVDPAQPDLVTTGAVPALAQEPQMTLAWHSRKSNRFGIIDTWAGILEVALASYVTLQCLRSLSFLTGKMGLIKCTSEGREDGSIL